MKRTKKRELIFEKKKMFKKRIELDENMNHQVKSDTTKGNAKKRKGEIRKKK